MTIQTECMLANLRIGVWEGRRLDKAASKEVTTRNGAEDDAARVNKLIVPKESLKEINTASGALRLHFYSRTVPWGDNGDRLLTRRMYLKFIEEHEALMNEFNRCRDDFVDRIYPAARDQAQFRMGGLFDPNDYPRPSELRRRFYAVMEPGIIATTDDFRVKMDQNHADKIKSDIEASMASRLTAAVTNVYERVVEELTHYHATMADPKKVFRDSTVKNLEEIIDLLPGLNITSDPKLDEVHKRMKAKLSGRSGKDLRDKPAEREAAAKETKEILDVMAGFLNATKRAA